MDVFAYFMMGDDSTCPHCAECSAVFDPKWHDALCPTLPTHLISVRATFFLFPWMDKVLNGKCFADVEEVKEKTAEALKASKSTSSKTVLSSGKKVSIGVLHQMKSTSKVIDV